MNRKKIESNTSILNQAKLKAREFIQNYQRQATERQFQKQKLKQNIMLQIMSNRHKSQKSQSNGRDNNHSQYSYPDSVSYKKMQSRVIEPVSEQRIITNNMVNKQSLGRSQTMPEVFYNQEYKIQELEYKENIQEENFSNQVTFKGGKDKNSNIFFQAQSPKYNNYLKKDNYQRQQNNQNQKITNQMTFRDQKKKRNSQFQDKITSRSSKYKIQMQDQYEQKDYSENSKSNQQFFQKQVEVFQKIVQNQSMQLGDQSQTNFVNFVAGQEEDVNQDIEIYRKKKIQQLKIKSQKRKQEAMKKNSQGKKSDSSMKGTKVLQTFGKKSQYKISEDPQPQFNRSKGKQRPVERQNRLKPKQNSIVHQSHYQVQKGKRKSNNHIDRQKLQNNSYKPVGISYNETPKTIQSQNRIGKSRNKNTIFRQSPSRNDKSANKYLNQPKIQPKQRKNTFIKQSNKKLMMNAISNVCLPGQINRKQREKLLQVLESESSQFFVFLFKEYSRKVIKAIYKLDHTQTILQKIFGQKAPYQIISQQVSSFYRFDSGCRQFKKLDGCKSFSLVVHAIDLR